MSYPILYSATETNFDHNGIGILSSCVSCEVTEEANGIFELEMEYPMDGIHFNEISDRSIIKAKQNKSSNPQLFRVYGVEKSGMGGVAKISAQHISYDLSGIPVKPFSAPTAESAIKRLGENAVVNCPFSFWTDKETVANFKVSVPSSIRSMLGGTQGSILDVYGGEFEFDNFTVKLHKNRGSNRGVSIRYGKNLLDIDQERNCSNIFTGVYPFWTDTEQKILIELPERIIHADGEYGFTKIMPLDLSADFIDQPSEEQLRGKALSYIKGNDIGIPNVSLTVSYAQLANSEEYKHLITHEQVSLFDEVNVEFPSFGVSATAKAVRVVYNVILDRVESVTLGSVRANIADTVSKQAAQIPETAKKEALRAVNSQTSEEIFNKLTDYGRIQGIYIRDGKWYINAEITQIVNLITEKLVSVNGNSTLNISGAKIDFYSKTNKTLSLVNWDNGGAIFSSDYNSSGSLESLGIFTGRSVYFQGNGGSSGSQMGFGIGADGLPWGVLPGDGLKNLSWQYSSELGKYVLCGE